MGKFKVGDKVRCVRPINTEMERFLGRELTIRCVNERGTFLRFDETDMCGDYTASQFDLVTKSELEQLVDKANEGLKLRNEIYKRFPGQLEVVFNDGTVELFDDTAKTIYSVEYRIKSKPKFEPYTTTNGWNVRVEGNEIHIGRKSFRTYHFLLEVLPDLLGGAPYKCIDHGGFDPHEFYATRTGIKWGQNILPWSDAEVLYNKLKELEK